jgi:hypothetical protein
MFVFRERLMSETDVPAYDLNDGRDRQKLLENIPPVRAAVKELHQTLLDLFRHELATQSEEGYDLESDLFENLYWCALLLYLVGGPADVPLMWQAKHINMDTGCGFDGQFLVGAGIEQTINYLLSNGQRKIADHICSLKDLGELDDLEKWEQFRIHYFHPIPKAK